VTLDRWQEEWVQAVARCGNTVVNAKYEATLDASDVVKPTKATSDEIVEQFIREKYEKGAFLATDTATTNDEV
jgi:hypothetical protein